MTSIIHLRETDSTNSYVGRLLQTEYPKEGTLYWTARQNAGRGQAGNSWESQPDMNLCFSMIFYPDFIAPAKQFWLSKLLGVALVDFADSLGVEDVSVKWPNDLYAGSRKLGGVLIETVIAGSAMKNAVAGVGINVNQRVFSPGIPNPVSLAEVAGKTFQPANLAPLVQQTIMRRYEQARSGHLAAIDRTYHERLYRRGMVAAFSDGSGRFEGILERVGEDGRLFIKTREGEERKYWLKEVVFL
ncbi:MAG: biotin--[acetyl-CoA-carboxylase] ligase [Bacteroidales bacterium]